MRIEGKKAAPRTSARWLTIAALAVFYLTTRITLAEPGASEGQSTGVSGLRPPGESVVDRFLRYVKIDTQSKEDVDTVPSTRKQMDLARLLARELEALKLQDVRVSEHGIVYARLPGNVPEAAAVPVLGLIAHMDTSPEVSGTDVHPIVHTNYQGGDIVLPEDPSQAISVEKNPVLKSMVGDDIITADGTTLLGSDDKAGCAAILTLLDLLQKNPDVHHGPLAIAFTPDEEAGSGVDKLDINAFGAKYAYTVDGGALGEIGNETWNARHATVTFLGKNTHPGTAKGVMTNSLYAVADFISRFPPDMRPETTEGRTGFVHPFTGSLGVDESSLKVLLRDFDVEGLRAQEMLLREMASQTEQHFPGVKLNVQIKDDYQNMREVLKDHPQLIEYACEAARRAGLNPKLKAIRGGTDGSNLTFRGLPCPDLFTGGHNFHGKLEFNSRIGLEKTTETLLNLVQILAAQPHP
jgi:tripeptide aminopeptidase